MSAPLVSASCSISNKVADFNKKLVEKNIILYSDLLNYFLLSNWDVLHLSFLLYKVARKPSAVLNKSGDNRCL